MSEQTAPADGVRQDAIHDIGFRHYSGERAGRGWITRSLLVDTLRGVFGLGRPARAKVMPWILVGILCAPPLVIALVSILFGTDELPVSYKDYVSTLQVVLALFVAAAAPYAVSRDLRYGVMPLYLSRPMERTDYVAARYGGLVAAVFLVMAVPQTLLLVGALLAELPVGDQLVGWGVGLLTSALLAAVLAAIGLAVAAYRPRRGLGVAAVITVLLVVAGIGSIVTEIAIGRGMDSLARLVGVIDPFSLVDGIVQALPGVEPTEAAAAPLGAQVAVYGLVYLLVLGVSGLLLVRRYRKAAGL